MVKLQIICDFCHEEKKETNHWWLLYPNSEENGIVIEPMGEVYPTDLREHFCSENCVVKKVSEYMGKFQLKSSEDDSSHA